MHLHRIALASLFVATGCCRESLNSTDGRDGGLSITDQGGGGDAGGAWGADAGAGGSSGELDGGPGQALDAGHYLGELLFVRTTIELPFGAAATEYGAAAFFGSALAPTSLTCEGLPTTAGCCLIGKGTPNSALTADGGLLLSLLSSDGGLNLPTSGPALPSGSVSAGDLALADQGIALGGLTFQRIAYPPIASCVSGGPSFGPCDGVLAWNGGDSVTTTAAGGAVLPFSVGALAPPVFANVNPGLSPPFTVPLDGDFTVSWSPATGAAAGGTVTLTLGAATCANPPKPEDVVFCQGTDAAGSMTVPGALLSQLTAGDLGYVSLTRALSAEAQTTNATLTLATQETEATAAQFGTLACLPF